MKPFLVAAVQTAPVYLDRAAGVGGKEQDSLTKIGE